MKHRAYSNFGARLAVLAAIVVLLATACTTAASPTPTPTKAAPAATPTAASPKVEATKPAEKPATTPTTAVSKPTGAAIKIGFVTPLSGPIASYGALQRVGVRLAEADINSTGGINGSPLQLLTEDSPFDARQAVIVVRKLAEQDKVFAIVGPYGTAEFENAAPLSNDLKIPVVTPSAMKSGVASKNRPYSFQLNLKNDVVTPATIDAYKKRYPNVKRVVLTGDTKQAVTEEMVKDVFPRYLKEKGIEIIDTVSFETGMADLSAVVTRIKSLNPDGVVLAATMPEGITFAKEYERQAMKAPVMTSGHVTGGPFVESVGNAVNGWIMASIFNWEDPDPKAQSFARRFFEAAAADSTVKPTPGHISNEGYYYDTIMLMADIMKKAGVKGDTSLQEARDKIRDGMQNLKDYPGVSGKISMDPNGEAIRQAMPAITAVDGKWAVVK